MGFVAGIQRERIRRRRAQRPAARAPDPDRKQVLNYLERIAVGIKHNVYDRDIAYEFFGAHIPAVCRWCRPWIEDMRHHAGDPSLMEAMESLSAQWEPRNRDIVRELVTPTWREGKAPT